MTFALKFTKLASLYRVTEDIEGDFEYNHLQPCKSTEFQYTWLWSWSALLMTMTDDVAATFNPVHLYESSQDDQIKLSL